jgi:hypothetical protein
MLKNRLWIAFLAISIVAISVVGVSAAHVNRSSAQPAPDPTCASTSPCIEYQNSSSGPGIEGVSKSGNGVYGVSTTAAAVRGSSTSGYGVNGSSSSSAGVHGVSSSGTGVIGTSTNGVGVSAVSTNSNALVATTTSTSQGAISASGSQNDGIDSLTTNNSTKTEVGRSGIYAHDGSFDGGNLNFGVYGQSINGTGVEGISTNFVGVNAVGGFLNTTTHDDYPALSIVGDTTCGSGCTDSGNDLIHACPSGTVNPCDYTDSVFSVWSNGIVTISGEIFTAGSCITGCVVHNSVKQGVRFYTPRESLPTVEDFGEAQLTAGHAYVRIDPAFADTIDQYASYMVFITPEGDSNGVYVMDKTPIGFEVRENRGGHSTLAFSYRIVAKPYGENAPRLQRFTIHLPRPSLGNNNMLHPGTVAPVR